MSPAPPQELQFTDGIVISDRLVSEHPDCWEGELQGLGYSSRTDSGARHNVLKPRA